MLPLRFQHPDTADVTRVAPDQESGQAVASCDPRFERIGVVVNVVDDKAGASQSTANDGQEIDQKSQGAGDDSRYTDTRHGF
ncbi:Uncharacterised protein [Enterobacter hormaechei]|nr:Uncharacterised protein [Enterobacter hormaechei]SAD87808.1 Uncharacterised protein [Enterobacter hormaechei]